EEDLTQKTTKRYIFVERGGGAKRIEVSAGLSDDTYQEITSGVGEGDSVITGPDRVLRALKDGDRVAIAGSLGRARCPSSSSRRSRSTTRWASSSSRPWTTSTSRSTTTNTSCSSARRGRASRR